PAAPIVAQATSSGPKAQGYTAPKARAPQARTATTAETIKLVIGCVTQPFRGRRRGRIDWTLPGISRSFRALQRGYGTTGQARKQDPPHGWMLEQRQEQIPVPIELRRPANDGHDTVGPGQLEERVDLLVRETIGKQAQRQLRIEFRTEPLLPGALVARQVQLVERVVREAVGQDLRGQPGTHEAVVDASTGR